MVVVSSLVFHNKCYKFVRCLLFLEKVALCSDTVDRNGCRPTNNMFATSHTWHVAVFKNYSLEV